MKIPVNRLLQAPHPVGRVPEPGTPALTQGTPGGAQRVVDLHDGDTPEDDPQTDSASEADIARSGAEFCNVDSDIARGYGTVLGQKVYYLPCLRYRLTECTGVKRFKPTTPYAVVNMKNAVWEMRAYVTTNVFKYMDYFLRGSDQLVKETYGFAQRYMQRSKDERNLLRLFFRLWFAVRRTATMEHIVGDDLLDMEPETKDESYPLFGKVPLPPVMIQQLDMILTLGILEPLRKQVLEEFQKLALANNPRNWMTIYLVTFMSLHSCAKITAEQYDNGRKHGLLRRYAIPNCISDRHHSANVFLLHFHYRTESCNPFKQDWKMRHMTPFSYMSVDDIQFLERTKVLLKDSEVVIQTNAEFHLCEHELYFIAQMF
ncbi:hypothetical protein C8A05DRAFT_39394 [Staphylotrichum tortipilum]|uniref:Uncharacterized protein n=1 Tax=Staphylotrichum tortipilum TaxID=2831512 RepID=A0AAN6MAY2_9PEZI|nr:hypothetical protein C8A05DRAFT_39394 [Staphylotrichum longicolle]